MKFFEGYVARVEQVDRVDIGVLVDRVVLGISQFLDYQMNTSFLRLAYIFLEGRD